MNIPLKIGEFIYMQQKLLQHNEPIIYKARIADLSEHSITIEMPLAENGKYGFFLEGSELIAWYDANDGSRYDFECSVLGRKKETVPLTLLSVPEIDSIQRTQRRNFIRVPCYEEIAIHPLNNGLKFTSFLAKVVDISGGGIAFSLLEKTKLEEGTEFKWWLSLNLKSGPVLHPTGTGRLVRIIEPSEKGLPYKYSVQFGNLLEPDRQKIMRFCFERQLEIKRKGIEL